MTLRGGNGLVYRTNIVINSGSINYPNSKYYHYYKLGSVLTTITVVIEQQQ